MKWFFDTSVLHPVFHDDDIRHEASLAAYLRASGSQGACAAHSLAELYATLTRLPSPNRMTAEQALLAVDDVRGRLSVISLDPDEYRAAIAAAAGQEILGGTVYDLLIAHCALKAKAGVIFTWNIKHFQRCGPEIAKRVRTP